MANDTHAYDLISSPMMLNAVIRDSMVAGHRLTLDGGLPCAGDRAAPAGRFTPGRGYTRTATTLLDFSATRDEVIRYSEAAVSRQSAGREAEQAAGISAETRRLTMSTSPLEARNGVASSDRDKSPAYNLSPLVRLLLELEKSNQRITRGEDSDAMATLADKLASARMMSKSGYSWDQNVACARIRLGDGAILQNLYPCHSHVKLLDGRIERIDEYARRFLGDCELLKRVTLIKSSEYNQWARTKPLKESDYSQSSKPIPLEKMESRSTQPSWDTLRSMNSTTTLSMKHRLFSYDDLAAKFSEPRFLKRMGFPVPEPNRVLKEEDKESQRESESPTDGENERRVKEELEADNVSSSSRLSSDDEEYYRDEPAEYVPPERIPSSKRTSRQQLAIYKDSGVIGSRSPVKPARQEPLPLEKPPEQIKKHMKKSDDGGSKPTAPTVPLSTLSMEQENSEPSPKQRSVCPPAKSIRKSKSFKLDIATTSTHRRFVPFSQPVCLCPKLSKETMASFYSPMMQHYFTTVTKNGYLKCKLHGPSTGDSDKVLTSSL